MRASAPSGPTTQEGRGGASAGHRRKCLSASATGPWRPCHCRDCGVRIAGPVAMEAVLNDLVSVEDLKKFEKKFQSEQAAGSVSKSTQFEYAWCLVRSKYNDDIRRGITLLEELLPKGSKEEQRDYVFYLAVGNYRLKEYEKALKYVRGLLQTEPQNNQAKELERLIDKAMKKDGLVGMAIVGGMALGVAGLAGLIGLAVSKSKS